MKLSLSGKVTIASNIVVLGALGAAWSGVSFPLLLSYELHKLLHLTGVILFLGNATIGPVWLSVAYLARDPGQLRFAARTLALCDIVCTVPGIQLATWNGLCLATAFGGLQAQPWLAASFWLLVGTAIAAPLLVLPVQERFLALAEEGAVTPRLQRWMVAWSVVGTLVMVPLGLVFYLMVAKRPLW